MHIITKVQFGLTCINTFKKNSLVVTFEVWDDDSTDAATSPPDKLEVVTFQVGQGEPVPFSGVSSFTRKTLNGNTLT